MTGESYSAGIEEVLRDGASLKVYGVAKTVADCFKHRNRIGLDVALEALKDAWAKRKATTDDTVAICRGMSRRQCDAALPGSRDA